MIDVGGTMTMGFDWTAALGKYRATTQVWYDADEDGTAETAGAN